MKGKEEFYLFASHSRYNDFNSNPKKWKAIFFGL